MGGVDTQTFNSLEEFFLLIITRFTLIQNLCQTITFSDDRFEVIVCDLILSMKVLSVELHVKSFLTYHQEFATTDMAKLVRFKATSNP